MKSQHRKTVVAKITSVPLIRHASFAFIGTIVAGAGNYVFNLINARLLTETEFGIFSSIISILTIISVIETTLSYRITNLTAAYEEQGNHKATQLLMGFAKKKVVIVAIMISGIIVLLSPLITGILHLNSITSVIIIAAIVPLTILNVSTRGFLQGMLKFGKTSLALTIEVLIKIVASGILIYGGLSYSAPLIAIGVGALAAYGTVRFFLRKGGGTSTDTKETKRNPRISSDTAISWKTIGTQSIPTVVALIGVTLFYTIDIIAVRYFFGETQPELVGNYSTISLLGKIIFFAAQSIGTTIFPMASREHANGNTNPLHLLQQGVTIVGAIGATITLAYWLFPEQIVKLLFGEKYIDTAPLIGLFGIAASLIALINVFTNYYLSIKQVRILIAPLMGIMTFLVLTAIHHSSLHQVIVNLLLGAGTALLLFFVGTLRIQHSRRRQVKK